MNESNRVVALTINLLNGVALSQNVQDGGWFLLRLPQAHPTIVFVKGWVNEAKFCCGDKFYRGSDTSSHSAALRTLITLL